MNSTDDLNSCLQFCNQYITLKSLTNIRYLVMPVEK